MLCDGFWVCSKIFCTLLHIACQPAYVIYDAIIYSKRPLLRLRPLPSNDELSAAKAHWQTKNKARECQDFISGGGRDVKVVGERWILGRASPLHKILIFSLIKCYISVHFRTLWKSLNLRALRTDVPDPGSTMCLEYRIGFVEVKCCWHPNPR